MQTHLIKNPGPAEKSQLGANMKPLARKVMSLCIIRNLNVQWVVGRGYEILFVCTPDLVSARLPVSFAASDFQRYLSRD